MPFRFDCPASECTEHFGVVLDTLDHLRAAHPDEPVPSSLPGSFVTHEQLRGKLTTRHYACRRCASPVSTTQPYREGDRLLCADCESSDSDTQPKEQSA